MGGPEPAADADFPRRKRSGVTPAVLALVGGGVAVLGCCGLGVVGLVLTKAGASLGGNQTVKWGEAARVGPIEVRLKDFHMGGFGGPSPSGRMYNSTGRKVIAMIAVKNTDPSRSFTIQPGKDGARLLEIAGSEHRPVALTTEFGERCKILRQLDGRQSLAGGQSLEDLIPFEQPGQAVDLTLTLDGACYGGTSRIAFQIPARVWNPAEAK